MEEVVEGREEEVSVSVWVACVWGVWCDSASICEVSGLPCE